MSTTHKLVSAQADDAVSGEVHPSDWNDRHATSLLDTEIADQAERVVLTGTDRLTAASTSRLRAFESFAPFRGTYSLGSVEIADGTYQLQYKRATLADTARASLRGAAELFLFDLAPVGRLVLAGRGI